MPKPSQTSGVFYAAPDRAWWQRILDIGVPDGMSHSAMRHVRFVTFMLVVSLAIIGAFTPMFVVVGMYMPALVMAAQVALILLALWLQSRGYYLTVKLFFVVTTFFGFIGISLLSGSLYHEYMWFLVGTLFAALAFRRDERVWAAASIGLMSLGYLLFAAIWRDLPNALPPATATSTWHAVTFAVDCALLLSATSMVMGLRGSVDSAEEKILGEQAKSDKLLRNILPAAIAERLKDSPEVIADGFGEVSVLFSDVVGFTPMSERLAPGALVGILNEMFSGFDELATKHGLEKIKTIGDAYMVVGGLPAPRADHIEAMAEMALDMLAFVENYASISGEKLGIRIGMHTGPVVAGVIGKSKFAYDLWGDTVNTASRMESGGLAGKIQVTAKVHERLQGRFEMQSRGQIEVKGKGLIETWFLLGRTTPSPPTA